MNQPNTSSAFKTIFRVFMVSIFGLVLGLGCGEVLVRAYVKFSPKPVVWRDRPRLFVSGKTRPNCPTPQRVAAKQPGKFRVVVLGDSFTAGPGLLREDTYSARLEQLLRYGPEGERAEVLNWGVSGYSTAQEIHFLQKAIARAEPDLVILEITLNDAELRPFRVENPNFNKQGEVELHSGIFQYSALARLVMTRMLYSQSQDFYIKYHAGLFEDPKTWNRFADSLRVFASITKANHAKAFSFIFPMFSFKVNEKYPFHPVHEKINAELKKLAIPHLDLRKAFTNIPPERLAIIPGKDSHPNEIANRIAAERLYLALIKHSLIPPYLVAPRRAHHRKWC